MVLYLINIKHLISLENRGSVGTVQGGGEIDDCGAQEEVPGDGEGSGKGEDPEEATHAEVHRAERGV